MDENAKAPVAVCEAELTDDIAREGIRTAFRRRRTLYAVIITIGLLSAILFLLESVVFHDGDPNTFYLVYGAFLVVYGLLGCTVLMNRAINKQLNTMKMLGAGNGRIVFSEDSIFTEDDRGTSTVAYSVFFKAVECRHLWLLYAGDKKAARIFMVPKDGFADEDSYRLFQEYAFRHLDPKSVKRLK